jgi:hypothetical protein
MLQYELEVPKREIEAAIGDIGPAVKAGLQRVAEATQQIAVRKVVEIRKRPVPTRANGKPMWEPTGNLARSVEAQPQWEGPETVFLTADVPYAARRHSLGVDWIPAKPALGVIRKNPFFAEAVEVVEPQAAGLFAEGFESVWEND